MRANAFSRGLEQGFPDAALIARGPTLEAEMAANPRRDVPRGARVFDGQRSRTRHGVDEGFVERHATQAQYGGGQRFLERRFHHGHAVAAAVEGLARQVDEETRLASARV